jgi:hypothetical protein
MQWVADDSSVYSSIESYHILVDVCGDSASGRIPGASGWLRPERWRSNVTRLCGGSWRRTLAAVIVECPLSAWGPGRHPKPFTRADARRFYEHQAPNSRLLASSGLAFLRPNIAPAPCIVPGRR